MGEGGTASSPLLPPLGLPFCPLLPLDTPGADPEALLLILVSLLAAPLLRSLPPSFLGCFSRAIPSLSPAVQADASRSLSWLLGSALGAALVWGGWESVEGGSSEVLISEELASSLG